MEKLREWVARSREFLGEVVIELRKVTWPTWRETVGSTAVVLVMVLIMAAFFYVVDVLLTLAVRSVL